MATPVQIANEYQQPDQLRSKPSDRWRYISFLVALPLFLYLIPFAMVRTPGYIRWGGSMYSPALDYSFTTAGENADIVIYGDSSAFYGVSPVEMSQELGMKVINLPNTGGSLPVIDDLPLRYYLEVNQAPKLIVFYFAPWDLDYLHVDNRFLYEGEEVLLRHGSLKEIAAFAWKHPFDILEFPFKVYLTGPKAVLTAALQHHDRFKGVAANGGHIEPASSGGPASPNLQSPCRLPAAFLDRGSQSVQELRGRYLTGKSKILVFLAPVPACDNVTAIKTKDYSRVYAVAPKLLPPTSYRDDYLYIHLAAPAVPAATAALTSAVQRKLAEAPQ